MATVPKKTRVTAGVFLGFITLLFVFNVIIALPLSSVNIASTGRPSGGTHDWYVLDEGTYTVTETLHTMYLHTSFMSWLFGKESGYFRVQVNEGPGAPYSMLVRACGKEYSALSVGDTARLYGMVSETMLTPYGTTPSDPCLNDNGDTILSRCGKSFIFLVIAAGAAFLTWMVATGRQFKRDGKRWYLEKQIFSLLFCCIALSTLTGCQQPGAIETARPAPKLTTEETKLLQTCFPTSPEISEGNLFDYQEEALYQLRAGMQYIRFKYPSYDIGIEMFESATKTVGYATLIADDANTMVRVRPTDDDYYCNDNFYGILIQDDYAAYLEDVLLGLGYMAKTYTRFPELLNDALDEDASLEDYLRQYPKLTKDTDIFVSVSDFQNIDVAQLEQSLRHQGVYGSFTLYSVDDVSVDIGDLVNSRRDLVYQCFNCF